MLLFQNDTVIELISVLFLGTLIFLGLAELLLDLLTHMFSDMIHIFKFRGQVFTEQQHGYCFGFWFKKHRTHLCGPLHYDLIVGQINEWICLVIQQLKSAVANRQL